MTRGRRLPLISVLVTVGLAFGMASAVGGAALAAASCPTVNPSTGAVSPAPSAGVDWAGCDLSDAYLYGADMADAQLQGANLTSADLNDANLSGADLAGAVLTNASAAANLSGANLSSANLLGTFMVGADLDSADLANASLTATNLSSADLKDASLQDADLDGTELESADLFGASLTGVTIDSVDWTNAICPNGASANYYTSGCLSPVSVTTPSATPAITAGTVGNNGWYTSAVTVTWYWVDSNSLVTAKCPSSTTTSQQGSAVVISGSCTDSAGNTASSSMTVKIDTTPPVVTLTGIRNGGIYQLDQPISSQCTTTDSISGVAKYAVDQWAIGARPDGSGVQLAECSGAEDEAGNVAPTVSVRYTVVYAFGGFLSPAPDAGLNPSARKIVVRFRLANYYGQIIPTGSEAALAATYDLRATLRGPDTKPVTGSCSWNGSAKAIQCSILRPRRLRTGKSHKYTITVTENLGSGFLTAPADAYSENPEPVYFK